MSVISHNHPDFSADSYRATVKDSKPLRTKLRESFFAELSHKTEEHIRYLSSIGLEERGNGIRLNWFQSENLQEEIIDVARFDRRCPIPEEVLRFDPSKKNTIITTDPLTESNKPEDLKKILDIRLYPVLRNLMQDNKVEIFLGTKREMEAYYSSLNLALLFEFKIPSSATYYLAESSDGKTCLIMGGLVSRENVIAQLLTLKLADINVEEIEIIGEFAYFEQIVQKDIDALTQEILDLKQGPQLLIVAGCGLEDRVNKVVQSDPQRRFGAPNSFKGNIVSLTHTPLVSKLNDVHGVISLNLNYGDITESIVSLLIEHANCRYVFTGGAGGYIPNSNTEGNLPPIGSRIKITQSMNEKGEVVRLGINELDYAKKRETSSMHLQISSLFFETYEWLLEAQERGTSIDVETFYIIRAIEKYNANNQNDPVVADCGCFVSDYVGMKPLREYSEVYTKYNEALTNFFDRILGDAKVPDVPEERKPASLNLKSQTVKDIIVSKVDTPDVTEWFDGQFMDTEKSDVEKTQYRQQIFSLNRNGVIQSEMPRSEIDIFSKKMWDINYYDQVNLPIVLGKLDDTTLFSQADRNNPIRFLDLPIFMPGQGWKIPGILSQFREVIAKAVDFEKEVNPHFEDDHYVYITIDQGLVPPHTRQRRAGWHADSFRNVDSRKRGVELPTDNLYVICDCCPTVFVPGPAPFNEVDPENLDQVLEHFTTIAEKQSFIMYPNHTLIKMDPYCIHNAGHNNSEETLLRTFVKISISKTRYRKLGNMTNQLFQYNWNMIPRQGVPYSKDILAQSSHRKDIDRFLQIQPHKIDFSQPSCQVSWAKEKVLTCYRSLSVHAEVAKTGEMLKTMNDGSIFTIGVAEENDWKVTTDDGVQYFLSNEQFRVFYEPLADETNRFLPKKTIRKAVELVRAVTFMAPWGTRCFAEKGDYIVYYKDTDIYPIPKNLFENEHKLINPDGN